MKQNIRKLGLAKGIVKESGKNVDNLVDVVKPILKELNVSYNDTCCNDSNIGFSGASSLVVQKDATTVNSVDNIILGTNLTLVNNGSGSITIDSNAVAGANIIASDVTEAHLLAGVLRPTYDINTGQNTWAWIDDADHTKIGFSNTVTADSSKVTINYLASFPKIASLLVTPDESFITMTESVKHYNGVPNSLFYSNGGYQGGSRVYLDKADIYIAKPTPASVTIQWNGSSWNVASDAIGYFGNPTSPAWNITWNAGRLRIKDIPFNPRSFSVNMVAANGDVNLMKYVPFVEGINQNWYDIYFWDMSAGGKYTSATPVTGFTIKIDLGTVPFYVNPLTEDFGSGVNFWIIGIMKVS